MDTPISTITQIKKVKVLKTENRAEYQKIYMREYTKDKPTIICDVCNGKYKLYQKYIHDKGKIHNLLKNKLNLN